MTLVHDPGNPYGAAMLRRAAAAAPPPAPPATIERDPTDTGQSPPGGPARWVGNPHSATLAEARAFVEAHRPKGANCPCCGQYARTWRRSLLAPSVADLCRLVALQRKAPSAGRFGDSFHITEFSKQRNGNFALLKAWGLVIDEEKGTGDERKHKSGRWRATADGVRFALGEIMVPKYVITYDQRVLQFEGPRIGVRVALRNRFDYGELMRGVV